MSSNGSDCLEDGEDDEGDIDVNPSLKMEARKKLLKNLHTAGHKLT